MLALTGAQKYYFVEGVTDMRLGQYQVETFSLPSSIILSSFF